MNSVELKHALLDYCKAHISDTIEHLKKEMDDCQQQANEYGQPKDRYDAFRSQLWRKRENLGGQLVKAAEELAVISQINIEQVKKCVEFGALVITDKQKLFVACSLGKIELDGQVIYAVSPAVPIIQSLKGKKAGETAFFNGKIEIKEIY